MSTTIHPLEDFIATDTDAALLRGGKLDRCTPPQGTGAATFCLVDELLIDSYQRDEVSEANTKAMAAAFSWTAFGRLVVMQRRDGRMFVVDGQQRLCAAKVRGETIVPCVVFPSDGPQHEASEFHRLNVRRVRVTAPQKFRAAAMAGIQPETEIARWLDSIGLTVMADGKSPHGVCFPAVLLDSWRASSENAKRAITLQRMINVADPLCGDVHKGLCWLLANGIDVGPDAKKLSQLGGRAAMLHAIKVMELETVQRASYRVCGLAILKLVNHRRRKKIPVPGEAAAQETAQPTGS
jgi:hypothetical protein